MCRTCLTPFLTLVVLLAFKSTPPKKPAGPLPMDPVNVEEGYKLPSQLLRLCSEVRINVYVTVRCQDSNLLVLSLNVVLPQSMMGYCANVLALTKCHKNKMYNNNN